MKLFGFKKMNIMVFFWFLFFLAFQNIYSQSFNVENFGVNGFDMNDDTVNFDKAIEHMCQMGGTLHVPKGNYYLNNLVRDRIGVNGNNYIFVTSKSFTIKLNKDAVLHYQNNFKGFRFRSTNDPDENTINKYQITLEGGVIEASNNFKDELIYGNPEIWGIVGETLESFSVENLTVKYFNGTAAIASYSNNNFTIINSNFINVTGNPKDLADNHGDAIYSANTSSYKIIGNKITNSLTGGNRIGRIGICIEYERSKGGIIEKNIINGYDRGIHIELIKGNTTIFENKLEGNISGIVLWNNYNYKQSVKNNIITNYGLKKHTQNILYKSCPILLLQYNTNNGAEIVNNNIIIYNEYFLPQEMMQVTSSNVKIVGNNFLDYSRTLSFSVSQGKSSKERVSNIQFKDNTLSTKRFIAYDGSTLEIQNNILDIDELILSFDNSKNIYRSNNIKQTSGRKPKINLYGKYN